MAQGSKTNIWLKGLRRPLSHIWYVCGVWKLQFFSYTHTQTHWPFVVRMLIQLPEWSFGCQGQQHRKRVCRRSTALLRSHRKAPQRRSESRLGRKRMESINSIPFCLFSAFKYGPCHNAALRLSEYKYRCRFIPKQWLFITHRMECTKCMIL